MTTNQTERVSDEELDQMIWKLERDGMTPKQLSLMRELREVRKGYLMQFTKEQRDILIKTAEYMANRENTSDYSENIRKVAEIALAALTAPLVTDAGEHFQRGYDEGHSRGLTCGNLYKTDDQVRQHRAACVAAYRAEIYGGEID